MTSYPTLKTSPWLRRDFFNRPFEKQIAKEKFLASILDHMNILTEKEKKVVSLKYGLYNNKPMTASEIKDELKCTRAVIRDLERRIRYKLEKAGVNFPEV